MTTFIKTKFKISDDQTNIDKYRLAANIYTVYQNSLRKGIYFILSKLILQRIIIRNFCGPESHMRKVQYRICNPNQIAKSKKKNIEIGEKQRNYSLIKNAKIFMF